MSKKDLAKLLFDFITKELEAGKTGVTNKAEKMHDSDQIKLSFYGSDGENLVLMITEDEIKEPKPEVEE